MAKRSEMKITNNKDLEKGSAILSAKNLTDSLLKQGSLNPNYIHYNEPDSPVKEYIPTGLPIDKMLGGGLPIGKIGEIFGEEGSGKSTLGYHLAVAVQKAGGYVVAIDTEHSWDHDRFLDLGGDNESIIVAEADTLEQVWNTVYRVMQTQEAKGEDAVPCLMLVDTIAGVSTADEIAAAVTGKDFSNMQAMARARYNSIQFRQIPRTLGALRIALVFINQVRVKMQTGPVMWGADPYESTGGKAMKFYASYRIKVKSIGKIKSGEEVVGQSVRFETVKCKTAPPWQRTVLSLMYLSGKFDQMSAILESMKGNKWYRKTKAGIKTTEVLQGIGFAPEYEDDGAFRADVEKHAHEISGLLLKPDASSQEEENGADESESTPEGS